MLKSRILTAVIAIPLLLLAIFLLPSHAFAWLISIVMLVAGYEWAALSNLRPFWARLLYCFVLLICVWMCAYYLNVAIVVLWAGVLAWCWLSLAVLMYGAGKTPLLLQYASVRLVLGWLVLSVGWLSLAVMRMHPLRGSIWLLYALVLVWFVDSGAYFAGKSFGVTPLVPRVSPKKTWQGLWGGLLAALFIIVIGIFCVPGARDHWVAFVVISGVAALISVMGDLSISVIKRIAEVKDTGVLFPGHGGMLDRLDSLLPALLVFSFTAMLLYR